MTTSLATISYYKTGGQCLALRKPRTCTQLRSIITRANSLSIPTYLIGAGSNSLVTEDYWPGEVISLKKMLRIKKITPTTVYCEAGVENTDFAKYAYHHGLTGAAWMYSLPGQLGGTIRMNARCYGGEISQIVTKVYTVDHKGNIKVLSTNNGDVFRGYKDTIFMDNPKWTIFAAEITLIPGDMLTTYRKMKKYYQNRINKGHFLYPSCGCIFKNRYDLGVPSGLLLESSGAKNMRYNQAVVSNYHANVVYNQGGATANDIINLTFNMRKKVWKKFGVWLTYEMEVLGSISPQLKSQLTEQRSESINLTHVNTLKKTFQATQH